MSDSVNDEPRQVAKFVEELGLPGIIDIHTHFMPKEVMTKVWNYFDQAEENYGVSWPITYRDDEQKRLETIRELGVVAFSSMIYAHKPGMARWLNEWAADFASANSDCLLTSTFYPEEDVSNYVELALDRGTRVFKVHIQVGDFDPCDPTLDQAWGMIAEAGTPVVIHCGSGPIPGTFTGPSQVELLLKQHPKLALVIAHMGAPEYDEFLDLSERYEAVSLDTTMAFTEFMDKLAPWPNGLDHRLKDAGLRGDVMFGSDFPNIPYSFVDQVKALDALDLGDEWMRKVLFDSAATRFGIVGD